MKKWMVLLWAALVSVVSVPGIAATVPKTESREVEIHFINVNAVGSVLDVGDCILIRDGETEILIDSGKSNRCSDQANYNYDDAIRHEIDYLRSLGIETLDYVIGTHPHEDHIGSLPDIIREFPVKKAVYMYEPRWDIVHESEAEIAPTLYYDVVDVVSRQIDENGNPMTVSEPKEQGEILPLSEDSYLRFFYIPREEQEENVNLNHMSMQIQYVYRDFAALFGGDGDARMNPYFAEKRVGHCQIYKAQHHTADYNNGKAYSSQELLDLITPEVCIITGHRTDENFWADNMPDSNWKRLVACCDGIYSTGKNGDIVVRADGTRTGYTITCSGDPAPLFEREEKTK